ncbi:MAG: hypothetical protein AB1401_00445 [Thermodesulfobacteriota bacterium]
MNDRDARNVRSLVDVEEIKRLAIRQLRRSDCKGNISVPTSGKKVGQIKLELFIDLKDGGTHDKGWRNDGRTGTRLLMEGKKEDTRNYNEF